MPTRLPPNRDPRPYDLLVVGEINPDLILRGDVEPAFGQAEKLVEEATLTVGSSGVILAMGAARLGLRVAFVGKCGDDVFGHFMLAAMQERGIHTAGVLMVPDQPTGFSVILSRPDGDRAILTYPGLIPALRAEETPDRLLAQARHLHVASVFLQTALQPGLPQLLDRAHAQGLTTSLDTNWDPRGQWRVAPFLERCDLFLPNREEVLRITRAGKLEDGLDILARQVPLLAVKLGAEGGLARRGSVTVRVPALPVEAVDTTGAGDSFDAGFLYGYLQGWPLERTLRLAVACGSLSTRAAGGVAAQPTLDEALTALEALP